MTHEFSRPRRTAVALDPHPLCHMALSTLLGRIDIDLVGTATTTDATLALLQEHRPDLLVLEVDLPEGREAALHLIASGPRDVPELTTVVLSGVEERCTVDAAFDSGAAAYVLKSSDPDEITTGIRQAFKPSPSLFLAPPRPEGEPELVVAANGNGNGHANGNGAELLQKLTRRELEILQLVSGGRSNRQVAQILWVADQTVKFHLANVYRKLGVRSRFEAAKWARENGILDVVVESGEAISMAEPKTNGSTTLIPLRRPTPRPSNPRGRFGETSR
jgi:DNA-binding NarL/FixJ family response regulator